MPGRSARAAAVLLAAGTAAALPGPHLTEGPPPGFTGGFGEPSCAHCHIGNDENAFGGRLSLEGLPDVYEPGAEYLLTVVLHVDETALAGFQVSARYAEGAGRGRSAGRLAPVDGRTELRDSIGVEYIGHSREGAASSDPSGSSWTFGWLAPEAREPVAIHVAANSGNGDNSPLGDLVYTHEALVIARR